MQLYKKIIALRKEKKWTQKGLSEKVGIEFQNISRWETEKGLPSADAIIKLAKAFDVSTDYLLFDDAPRNKRTKIHDPVLLEQFENIEQLKDGDQEALKKVIESMIIKNKMEAMMTGK